MCRTAPRSTAWVLGLPRSSRSSTSRELVPLTVCVGGAPGRRQAQRSLSTTGGWLISSGHGSVRVVPLGKQDMDGTEVDLPPVVFGEYGTDPKKKTILVSVVAPRRIGRFTHCRALLRSTVTTTSSPFVTVRFTTLKNAFAEPRDDDRPSSPTVGTLSRSRSPRTRRLVASTDVAPLTTRWVTYCPRIGGAT